MKRILTASALWLLLFAGTTSDQVSKLIGEGKTVEAFEVAKDRSAAGDAEGDLALGWFYEVGQSVTADTAKAAGYYRKCAAAGLAACQWRLGVLLDTGNRVTEDPDAAFGWIEKASAQGDLRARISLAVMYATGRGTATDYKKAMELYLTAAEARQAHGFYGVGILHALGQGVPADPQEAAAWIAVADSLGDERARPVLDKLLEGKDGEYRRLVTVKADEIYAKYVLPPETGKAPVPASVPAPAPTKAL